MITAFRRKPFPAGDPAAPGSGTLADRVTRSEAPRALDGSIADTVEADVARAVGGAAATLAAIERDVTATRSEVGRIEADVAGLVEAGGQAIAQASRLASVTQEVAATSGRVVHTLDQADAGIGAAVETAQEVSALVAALAEAAEDIVGLVDVVASVARQTNLVALNATVEAARAGPAGRGFALVANDVKALSVETSAAATQMRTRIARLCEQAGASVRAADQAAAAVQAVRPAAQSLRTAVGHHRGSLLELVRRTAGAFQAIERVNEEAHALGRTVREAAERISSAQGAGSGLDNLLQELPQRLMVGLRHSEIGDRRRFERYPVSLRAAVWCGDRSAWTTTIDVSQDGVLLQPVEGLMASPGLVLDLELEGVGGLPARVVAVSPMGVHCTFDGAGEPMTPLLARLKAEVQPAIEVAQNAAHQVAFVIEQAIADGRLSREQVFDTRYEPVAGTGPQQYVTAYLRVFEDLLPAIQEPLLVSESGLVFCVAADRNGYVPVHNRKQAHPQRPGDPVWNAANARNRRIFDDRAGMAAVRSSRPFLIQAYPRDMGDGTTVMLREVDAPIRLFGQHWGAFRTAYRL